MIDNQEKAQQEEKVSQPTSKMQAPKPIVKPAPVSSQMVHIPLNELSKALTNAYVDGFNKASLALMQTGSDFDFKVHEQQISVSIANALKRRNEVVNNEEEEGSTNQA